MDVVFSSLRDLAVLLCPFGIGTLIILVWILALNAFLKHMRQPGEATSRWGNILRYLLAPLTATIFLLSIPLAPVLALVGLVLAAVLVFILYPLSILVRAFPRILKDAMLQAEILSEKIFNLDEILFSGFEKRMREILRAFLGTLGLLVVRFPPLINLTMRRLQKSTYVRQRLLKDISFIEKKLQIDIAADLLLAIAIDPRHHQATRLEAVKLLSELGRPLGDLLHIISVPGIDAHIAIEAAQQAVSASTSQTAEWEARSVQVWEALAEHPSVESRLLAADQLSSLGKVPQARNLLRLLVKNRNIPPEYRAQAAGKLYESSVDTSAEVTESPEQIVSEAEQALTGLANSREARERLEGSAVLVRLGHKEYVKRMLDLLDDANLDPMLRRRCLELLAELDLLDELRFAVEKPAPTPELENEQRWEAIKAMEKVLPEEAVKRWAAYAAQPDLSPEKVNQALDNLSKLCHDSQERITSQDVQEGFATLREFGSNEATPAPLRLAAADTLESLDQIKDANAIYYVLQMDPKVDKRLRRKATQAVSRLSRALLMNRPGKQISQD